MTSTPVSPLDVEPGTPEVLAQDLVHATRIAFDGTDVLVLQHPGLLLGNDGEPDEVLRVPRAGGQYDVVLSVPSASGFVVDETSIWTSSFSPSAVIGYDKATGTEIQRVDYTYTNVPYQVVQSGPYVLAVLSPVERIDRIDKRDGSLLTLTPEKETAYPAQWLLADDQALYYLQRPLSDATLLRVALDGTGVAEVASFGAAIALGFAGADLVTANHDTGEISIVTRARDVRAIGQVDDPWAIVADENFAYVSSQPQDDCPLDYSGKVSKVPLAGGETVTLADNLPCPSMLLLGDDGLYWVNNGHSELDTDTLEFHSLGGGSLMRLPGG